MCCRHDRGFWEATPALEEVALTNGTVGDHGSSLRDLSRVTEEIGMGLEEPGLSICFARQGCLDQSQAKRMALSFTKCPCTSRWIF